MNPSMEVFLQKFMDEFDMGQRAVDFEQICEEHRITKFVYDQLARQYYSEVDYAFFAQRVESLTFLEYLLDLNRWIIDRNMDREQPALRLEIRLRDFIRIPEIFMKVVCLKHVIISKFSGFEIVDLSSWEYLREFSVKNYSGSKELRYSREISSEAEGGYLGDDDLP
jgi:hypothetical protein